MSKIYEINWKGDEVVKLSEEQLGAVLSDFALVAEGKSKKKLTKGHGVRTGTLRRSIHAASPDYDFARDNVEPSESTPELGGQAAKASSDGKRMIVALGSGLDYALSIHQGWGNFPGYHFLTDGVTETKLELDTILARHQVSE